MTKQNFTNSIFRKKFKNTKAKRRCYSDNPIQTDKLTKQNTETL